MSLLRLLSVGRSFVGPHPQGRRFRMTQQNLLPKFNAGPTPVSEALKSIFQSRSNVASPALKQDVTSAAPQLTPIFAQLKAPAKINPFGWRQTIRRGAAGVPGELALEKVQVVRNDLAEADLELVPIKSKPVMRETPQMPTTPSIRERLVSKWFQPASRLLSAARALF